MSEPDAKDKELMEYIDSLRAELEWHKRELMHLRRLVDQLRGFCARCGAHIPARYGESTCEWCDPEVVKKHKEKQNGTTSTSQSEASR